MSVSLAESKCEHSQRLLSEQGKRLLPALWVWGALFRTVPEVGGKRPKIFCRPSTARVKVLIVVLQNCRPQSRHFALQMTSLVYCLAEKTNFKGRSHISSLAEVAFPIPPSSILLLFRVREELGGAREVSGCMRMQGWLAQWLESLPFCLASPFRSVHRHLRTPFPR